MFHHQRDALCSGLLHHPVPGQFSSVPQALKVPHPVEQHVVPIGPSASTLFTSADSQWFTQGCQHQLHHRRQPHWMGPPPVASLAPKSKPKPKPTRAQVRTEIDTILREAEQRRLKRSEQERQMHDAVLTTILKAVRTLCLNLTWGFIPQAPRIGWDMTLHVSLSSGHSRSILR